MHQEADVTLSQNNMNMLILQNVISSMVEQNY